MWHWLQQPLTRGMDLDDPRTTEVRREVLRRKGFLRRVYREWYGRLEAVIPSGTERVLEIGSGAGFLADSVPGLLTSDVTPFGWLELVSNGQHLPFADASLRAVLMINVLHHVPEVSLLLDEAARVVRVGGVVGMIEPWYTPWSQLVYTHLHHERFDPAAPTWASPAGGPLSGGNGALPWIVFGRDRHRLEQRHPQWIVRVEPMMPFLYLLSGGVGTRTLVPEALFPLARRVERLLGGLARRCAMFALVTLERVRSE